jgi:thiamine biosynthesis protein ThiS
MDIEILLNGEKKNVPEGLTVIGLVRYLNLVPERLAVEYNSQILKRGSWEKRILSNGDKVEIVHFVGGGALDWCSAHVEHVRSKNYVGTTTITTS